MVSEFAIVSAFGDPICVRAKDPVIAAAQYVVDERSLE